MVTRIFTTFGDSDVRTVVCVPSTRTITKRILGSNVDTWLTWVDSDRALVDSLGLERLPALLLLRQDTTLVTSAQGWSPTEWQKVVDEIAPQRALDDTHRERARRPRADARVARRELSVC